MTALIWMLTWLPQVLPAVSDLPQPVNVNLTSNHFRHMLTWEPGPGTPTGVSYQVTVHTETGTSWQPVDGCEHVQRPLVCNLTEAFLDQKQLYLTRVTARMRARASPPVTLQTFQPIKDTDLDLPLLTVTPCGSDLCVDLQPPMEHLRESYDSLQYKLRVKSSVDGDQVFDIKHLRKEVLKGLAHGRQYCVSVCFSEILLPRKSNYSQPICAFLPGIYTADPLISTVLCLLMVSGVVTVALLIGTGFICLIRRPLPPVLTSIRHIEEVLVVAPFTTSLSSLLNLEPTAPSSGGKRNSQASSDESDGESVTESSGRSRGGGRGGNYKLRVGTNLLSSSSSSSSSSSLPPEPGRQPGFSSNRRSVFSDPQPEPQLEPQLSAETPSRAGLSQAPSSDALSSDSRAGLVRHASDPCPPKEDKEAVEGDSQGVNLLTLTFGRREEEEESHVDVAEVEPSSAREGSIGAAPSQTWDTKAVAIETVSHSVSDEEEEEEEEEEDHSGYMGRPHADVFQNSL
ncbi:interferon lambda receptor 1-like [Enoplosus armatus]|uniref:interferon lambda receptor 1-like n=1 Tax=Enoplosus armatus TaxID=215367 RepID=UPI0039946DAC